MRKYHVMAVVGALFLAMGFLLIAQQGVMAQEATEAPPPTVAEGMPYLSVYYDAWVNSAHADVTAEAFNHWNTEAEIPADCARCHSTTGYVDYMGGDGTAAGTVDAAAPLGQVVTCDACHNPTAAQATSVTFPSGATVENDSSGARCMQCHQGRESGLSVQAKIEELGLTETPDAVSADLGFINIHYFAAASTLYGSVANGGYQYDGQRYQLRNFHVQGMDTCTDCHNQHTLEVRVEVCAECHEDVETVDDLQFIRMNGSLSDYDGDGDVTEGIAQEIQGLQEILYGIIQQYATDVAGTPIIYSEASYPYFFIDTNANGAVDEGEAAFPNKYNAFTANLLRAAYNYQVTVKDPGGFAHNPQYMVDLLFDSIQSLNGSLQTPVEIPPIVRNDPGHFDTTAEAFRHWDAEGEVPGSCARCHSATGLPVFIENGVTTNQPLSNSLACSTCHDSVSDFTIYEVGAVTFPSGAQVSFAPEDETDPANLCITCHQGRESTVSVNAAIRRAGVGDDEVSDQLAFRNVHYFAAGATLFGGDVQGAYQFEGQEYNGRNMHDGEDMTTCVDCHNIHSGEVQVEQCADCHDDVETLDDVLAIRMTDEDEVVLVDYDGDGNSEEPIRDEIQSFQDALYVAMQAYATNTVGTGIVYSSAAYPYFFIDTNGNGTLDPDEATNANKYVTWTPNLLRAAYNYQYSQKDPGLFAHNPRYVMQFLYDSIAAVGGDVSSLTRPVVEAVDNGG